MSKLECKVSKLEWNECKIWVNVSAKWGNVSAKWLKWVQNEREILKCHEPIGIFDNHIFGWLETIRSGE